MTQFDVESNDLNLKYPLVYKHCQNYAAKLIQRAWVRMMSRTVFKYLLECARDFQEHLTPKDVARVFPEFLEFADQQMGGELQVKMQGESFPPALVCRAATSSLSVDGRKHARKWVELFNSAGSAPIDRRALSRLYFEAVHGRRNAK